MEFGTGRIKKYLGMIDNPQNDLPIIHITGTNGKGSVSRIIATILSQNNNKINIGTFNSPSLICPSDGIQINCLPISSDLYHQMIAKIETNCSRWDIKLSIFEKEVVASICIFKQFCCGLCIVEVGMGGLHDGTNIFSDNLLIALVTSVSFDHEEHIGPSMENILINKLGIGKPKIPIMAIKQDDAISRCNTIMKGKNIELIIKQYCDKNHIPLMLVDISRERNKRYTCTVQNQIIEYELSLHGEFQIKNSSLAIHAIMYLKNNLSTKQPNDNIRKLFESICLIHIEQGCKNVIWPGRLTWIYNYLLVDGAHNIAGILQLKNYVENYSIEDNITEIVWVAGITKGKNSELMLSILLRNNLKIKQSIILTRFTTPSNMPWIESNNSTKLQSDIKLLIHSETKSLEEILEDIQNRNAGKKMYIIFGSLYLISNVYQLLDVDPWRSNLK